MATATIDTAYDGYVTAAGTDQATATNIIIGNDIATTYRAYFRFATTSITTGSTVNDTDVQFNILTEAIEANEGLDFRSYNETGATDPEGDTAANKYSRALATTSRATLVVNGITGSQSVDLGATVDGQVQTQIGSFWAMGIVGLNTDPLSADQISLESIENAGTDPATLTVDYTAPSSGSPTMALMGVGT